MKYLLTFEKYLLTDTDKRQDTFIYHFNSPKNRYRVKITPFQGRENYYSVGFGIMDDEYLDYNTSAIVNENPFEVMDTVFSIMKEFADKYNPDGFIFSLTGEKKEQRLLLYKRTLNKHFPEAILKLERGIYYITI
jgi:hypothetical protein